MASTTACLFAKTLQYKNTQAHDTNYKKMSDDDGDDDDGDDDGDSDSDSNGVAFVYISSDTGKYKDRQIQGQANTRTVVLLVCQ